MLSVPETATARRHAGRPRVIHQPASSPGLRPVHRAIGYVRVSSADQVTNGFGLDATASEREILFSDSARMTRTRSFYKAGFGGASVTCLSRCFADQRTGAGAAVGRLSIVLLPGA